MKLDTRVNGYLERLKRPALWLVVALLVAVMLLSLLGPGQSYENTRLLTFLNIIFVSLISIVVAWVMARSFIFNPQWHLLFIGTAQLLVGISSSFGSLFLQPTSPNAAVTVFNICVLIAGLLLVISVIFAWRSRPAKIGRATSMAQVDLCYILTLAVIAFLSWAAMNGRTPAFVLAHGFSITRQLVLGISTLLFAITAVTYGVIYLRSRSNFIYWYSLGLGAFSIGLLGVLLQPAVGSILGWTGRSAQFLSGVYLFIAAMVTFREARARQLSAAEVLTGLLSQTEARLKESEEKYRNIVETASEGIWICDTNARTTFVNKKMTELSGYSQEEMISKTAYEFMDQEARELAKLNLERRLQGKKDIYEQKYIRKDGSTLWAIASAAPMLDKSGKIVASLGMITDITERKKAEQIKDDFIGMVSHELKTPLTVFLGAVKVAMAEGITNKEIQELLIDASHSAESMAHLVENLIELSRYQANRLVLATKSVDVAAVVRNLVASWKDDSHKLSLDIEPILPMAVADQSRLEQILRNLLDNAAKYSPDNTEIRVSVKKDSDHLLIGVSDHGKGISSDEQAKLFQSFERLNENQ